MTDRRKLHITNIQRLHYRSLSAVSTSVSGGGSLNAAAVAAGNGGASDVGGGRGFGEYCTSEWFNASCADVPVPPLQPPQQYQQQRHLQGNVAADDSLSVVVMTTAFYGRMRSGRCVQMKYGQPGCRADVLGQLDDECSGRPACQFPVSRLLANGVTPCDGELMSYLEAAYMCVKGQ
jgi:hypothetical protein